MDGPTPAIDSGLMSSKFHGRKTHDCGIFTIGYADHYAKQKEIALVQSDIEYYRCKVVADCYLSQWRKYGGRLG